MSAYLLMAAVFVIGYVCIALEHPIKIDKAASAILTAVICWTILVLGADQIFAGAAEEAHGIAAELRHHLGEIAEILFFLLGAMTIEQKYVAEREKARNEKEEGLAETVL